MAVTTYSLTSELKLLLQKNFALTLTVIELLNLYLCLWEYYIIKSASKIRLEEERYLLRSSNDWLARKNKRIHEAYTNQALLL